jgi:polysaccharide biosynthesis/export protein
MQDKSKEKGYINPYSGATAITEAYKVLPKDYLYIKVMTPNVEIANLYNLGGGMNSMGSATQGGSARFMSYLVNDAGSIDFPYVGEIAVKGLTLSEIKEKLTSILKNHIDIFTLQVQLTDPRFTILGEVRAPGQYSMSRDQLTLYEAFALAGDMTVYGKRNHVKIIRPGLNGTQTIVADLTDINIIDSQLYYIYPNDLIYIEPMKVKQLGFGETFSLSFITTIISFYLLIKTLIP